MLSRVKGHFLWGGGQIDRLMPMKAVDPGDPSSHPALAGSGKHYNTQVLQRRFSESDIYEKHIKKDHLNSISRASLCKPCFKRYVAKRCYMIFMGNI